MSKKEHIYYYVTSTGCVNIGLHLSMEEAIKDNTYFIDVFDEDGVKIIRYRKKRVDGNKYEYEVIEAM